MSAVRRTDVDRVCCVRPRTVDPGRCVGENQVACLDDTLRRNAAARRGRLGTSSHCEYGRNAPSCFPEHRRRGQPRKLGFAYARCREILDSLLNDIREPAGTPDGAELWRT